jgi:hypothetical protein
MALADDVLDIGGPAWWLHRLTGCLARDQARMVLMDRYYRGEHPLPFVPRKLRSEFTVMLARSRSNFMRIVVDAPAERLRLQGFRSPDAEDADDELWGWWVDNHMEIDSNIAICDAFKMARAYMSIWRFTGEDDARVQVEDPRGTYVDYDQLNRHRRVAALRVWNDDWTGKVRADVWLPDACYQYIADKDKFTASQLWPPGWEPGYPIDGVEVRFVDSVTREGAAPDLARWCRQWNEFAEPIPNPYGEIPIVPLVNRASTTGHAGESELDDVYLSQDRINEMLFNRALAAWTSAYRQKWATGLEIPVDEEGEPVEQFQAAVDRFWSSEDPATRFGSFEATDLGQFIDAIEQDVKHIAVQTRTPRHYLVESGQTPSGDSIKSAESGLVAKVLDRQPYFGRSFAEVARLRRVMLGEMDPPRVEAIWGDPEFRTLAELTDATIKQLVAGIIPVRVAQERLGFSPTEIERMATMLAAEKLIADAQAAAEEDEAAAEEEAAEELQVPVGA